MAIKINRSIFKQAFPDPDLEGIIMLGPWESEEAEVEAMENAMVEADELNQIVTFILTNASCERRIKDVLTLKPILAAKPLSLGDWDIARIACGSGKVGEEYPSDLLSVVANTIKRLLPKDKSLYDLASKELPPFSVIFLRTIKTLKECEEVVKDKVSKTPSLQAENPKVVGALEKNGETPVVAP